jgi:hypothetical protein
MVKRLFLVCGVGLILSFCAVAQQPGQPAKEVPAKSAAPDTATPTPSVDAILNRYLEALGGRAALEKLTSRVTTGTIDVPAMNISGTIEIHEKAPNRILSVVTISGAAFRQGFDGFVGWTDDPENGVREQTGAELYEARRGADFYHPLNLGKIYSKLNLVGQEKLEDRSVYEVEATPAEGGDPDRLYFDTQSGLVTRVITVRHLPQGVSAFREDFEDFRDVDGIKLPFTIHQSGGDSEFTIKLEAVHHNVEMDDAQFSKPVAKVPE